MNSDSWNDIHVAQLLASRTSAQWEQQVAGRTVDALDRVTENAAVDDVSHMFRRAQVQPLLNPGFPTLVSDVAAGYGWLVIANGTRIQSYLAHMKLETQRERQRRIELHESRTYVEREFVEPSSELGLNPDEQLAYALWLSSQQQSSATPGGYTTSCSASTSDLCDSSIASTPVPASLCLPDEDAASASHSAHFALEGMTEDEQLEYALFLSKSST
ncbi:hypothetical protein EV174_004915 [Coemansia sp. RSA 2320]|nr:hypothetical protein EV174_004915 [Coemansia sp. RSA 2320]